MTPAFGDTMRLTTWRNRKVFGRKGELRPSVLLHTFALLHLTHDLPAHCMVREYPPGDGMANTLQYSCLENPHGRRRLAGYSPWGRKQLDMTELLTHSLSGNYYPSLYFVVILVTESCLTLCNPMGCSPPGSLVHGISQARKLEWIAISFFRGSSRPRD